MQSIHYSGALNFIYNPLTSQAILPTFSCRVSLNRLREIYGISHCQLELFRKNIATIKAHFRRRRRLRNDFCMHLIEALSSEFTSHPSLLIQMILIRFMLYVYFLSNAGSKTLLRRTWWKFSKNFFFSPSAQRRRRDAMRWDDGEEWR